MREENFRLSISTQVGQYGRYYCAELIRAKYFRVRVGAIFFAKYKCVFLPGALQLMSLSEKKGKNGPSMQPAEKEADTYSVMALCRVLRSGQILPRYLCMWVKRVNAESAVERTAAVAGFF